MRRAEPPIDGLLEIADHVELLHERQELLRFGESRVTYQHSEEKLTVRARRGQAWVTLGSPDVEMLRGRLAGLRRGAVGSPTCKPRQVRTAYSATEEKTAEDRVAMFRAASESMPRGTRLGGSIAHTIVDHEVANVAGVHRRERRTRALLQLIAMKDDRSSYARALHRDASQLPDVSSLAEGLLAGLAPLPKRSLEPGSYRALLGPQAVIALAATLAQYAFPARHGTFAGCIGEQVLGENVSIVDDGTDLDGLPTTFDCMGTPKERVRLIDRGIAAAVVTSETGHAVPPGWRFGGGPSPSHVFVAAGDASDDELRAACDTGIAVQRVDYVRMMHPKQMLVTGSSRDATLWLERGRAVARLPQFRFTLRLDELFSSIEAVGSRRERGETVFMESVVAPAVAVSAFPVDVILDGGGADYRDGLLG